ncbi:MAG: hypothetical protein AB1705_06360 [Verrucomicrobiota bacterium]
MKSRTASEFEARILALSQRNREFFCCSCAEHILPFLEYFKPSALFREVLNQEWEYSREGVFTIEDLERLEGTLTPLVPNIQSDSTLRADICMKSAMILLETLDCITGEEQAATNVGYGVFDALLPVAHMVKGGPVIECELFEIINDQNLVPSLVFQ